MYRMAPAGFGSQATRTDRDIEYDIFSRVTALLRRAEMADDKRLKIEAVNRNIELWTALLTDLTQQQNRLHDELKSGLISLGIFSIRHGHLAMAEDVEITSLIDINTRMMRGLRGEVEI